VSAEAALVATLRDAGVVRWPCLDPKTCSILSGAADRAYQQVGVAAPPGYLPTAASLPLPLHAELDFNTPLGAALDPLAATLDVLASQALPLVRAALGSAATPLRGQRWLRRQYPTHLAPPGQSPHGWHQDGALHFDFLTGPDPHTVRPRALLTLWVPLVACGHDAPGLALVPRRLDRLLAPVELSDQAVTQRWGAEVWTPHLAAGEALLFAGDLLHRTARTAAMDRARTSLELRFESP
jgi:hypothetical protein